jgi:hypothetical protein
MHGRKVKGCHQQGKRVVAALKLSRPSLSCHLGGQGDPPDVLGEQPFGALILFVIHDFPVLQGTKAVSFNATEMDEDVLPVAVQKETEPLLRIEPFDGTRRHKPSSRYEKLLRE